MSAQQTDAELDRDRFYAILAELRDRIGERQLAGCSSRMGWPKRGIYFFFEAGELRRDGATPRVVRVGTHAVSAGSKTTLWKRLLNHRGSQRGGNHRGSIFRLHVGTALLNRGDIHLEPNSWGIKPSASSEARQRERLVEEAVTKYIGAMFFLWADANDAPGKTSLRAILERNSIGLLSTAGTGADSADPASAAWLGRYARHDAVRGSSLWNVRGTAGGYDKGFLDLLETCARRTRPLEES